MRRIALGLRCASAVSGDNETQAPELPIVDSFNYELRGPGRQNYEATL